MTTVLTTEEDAYKLMQSVSDELRVQDKWIKKFLVVCGTVAIFVVFAIIIMLFLFAVPFFEAVPLDEFLFNPDWDPANQNPERISYGARNIIIGSILVTIGAMAFSVPLGVLAAIFISELAPSKLRTLFKGGVEILSGIPSIIYGFFGLRILEVWLRTWFNLDTGLSWFNGSIILGVMALPTIISVAEDAITAVPKHYREASLAMGATKWQTISKVVIPAALSGITAAVILGMGRAIGETMAVMLITGNSYILPDPITNMFSKIRTITGTIGIEMGEAYGMHRNALFGLAVILFFITLLINSLAVIILKRLNKKFQGKAIKKRFKLLISTLENPKLKAFKKKLRQHKKLIFYSMVFLVLFWLFSTWVGILFSLLICSGILGLFLLLGFIPAKVAQRFWYSIIFIATGFILLILGIILTYIIVEGIPALSLEFFITHPEDGGRSGGIFPAIIGTLWLVGLSIGIAVPIGILAGIYLAEYAKESKFTRAIRMAIDNLNGTPSIVFGLFGVAAFVLLMGFGKSMIAASLTLAIMILPTIIVTTEESIKAIPLAFREGSLALGSTKWQSISKVVIPAAIPGIITGVILGMGRTSGETAPIMLTGCSYSPGRLPRPFIDQVNALPWWLFYLSTNVPGSDRTASGTALVLLILVVLLYSIAIIVRNYYEKKVRW